MPKPPAGSAAAYKTGAGKAVRPGRRASRMPRGGAPGRRRAQGDRVRPCKGLRTPGGVASPSTTNGIDVMPTCKGLRTPGGVAWHTAWQAGTRHCSIRHRAMCERRAVRPKRQAYRRQLRGRCMRPLIDWAVSHSHAFPGRRGRRGSGAAYAAALRRSSSGRQL